MVTETIGERQAEPWAVEEHSRACDLEFALNRFERSGYAVHSIHTCNQEDGQWFVVVARRLREDAR